MSVKLFFMASCACAALAGCGATGTDQALFGGAAGAGIAVVVNANPIKGAVVGAAGNYIYCQANPGKCN
jgi:osmotically inducible lipoprotein OsmB